MRLFLYIAIILTLLSCSKEETGPQCISCNESSITTTNNTDVVIVNEGNFGPGSGTITVYNNLSQTVSQSVFQQNNGFSLGNVAQSITQYGDKGYIVVNNSNKVEVVDINNFNTIGTITGFNSPRYLLPINNSKAYVTDLYSNSIQIVDLSNNSITGSIPLSGWTEELLLYNDTVYVCDMTNDNILIIDPATNLLIDSVKVAEQPNSIVKDKNNQLWVLCDGGFNQTNPELIKFNPQTRSIETTFVFPGITESPNRLNINSAGDQLYYINSDVYTMNINDVSLPTVPFINSSSNTYYGLGVDPINEDVYVSDAKDFVQNGTVFRYSSTGSLVHQFNSGIIPGNFLFIQ